MLAIADNLNTRNKAYMEALGRKDRGALLDIVKTVREANPDMINVQCSLDGVGDEENLPWVVEVLAASSSRLSLDSRNVAALRKSVPKCTEPPLINYLSKTEPADREALLSLVAESGASLVLRASAGTIPSSLEAKLQIIEDLIDRANAADIPNELLFADPSIVHIGRGEGQKHLVNSLDCIHILKDLIEPPINTIAWISNISPGMPKDIRKRLEAAFLIYLAGAGLDAAMVDVADVRLRKAVYLVKAFRDEIVFSQADIA